MWTIISLSVLCALLIIVIIKQIIVSYFINKHFSKTDIQRLLKGMIKQSLVAWKDQDKHAYLKIEFQDFICRNSLWMKEQRVYATCKISYKNDEYQLKYFMILSNNEKQANLYKSIKQFLIMGM